eukprot:8402535-Alexandrium_andersonii.AAC.1
MSASLVGSEMCIRDSASIDKAGELELQVLGTRHPSCDILSIVRVPERRRRYLTQWAAVADRRPPAPLRLRPILLPAL